MRRPSLSLSRRVVDAFTQQLGLKALAVSLAVILWFLVSVVSAKEPRETGAQWVEVRFEPQLDSSLVLRDPPPTIRAYIVGAAAGLVGPSEPVIRRRIDSGAPDTLVLDLRPSDVELPEGLAARVTEVAPATVKLRFEPTTTRRVRVRSAVSVMLGPGMSNVSVRLEPETVEVSGPRRIVSRLTEVPTARALIAAGDSAPHLVDLDTTGLGGSRLRPSQVKVHLRPTGRPAAAADTARRDSVRRDSIVTPRDSQRPPATRDTARAGAAPASAPAAAAPGAARRDTLRRPARPPADTAGGG